VQVAAAHADVGYLQRPVFRPDVRLGHGAQFDAAGLEGKIDDGGMIFAHGTLKAASEVVPASVI